MKKIEKKKKIKIMKMFYERHIVEYLHSSDVKSISFTIQVKCSVVQHSTAEFPDMFCNK